MNAFVDAAAAYDNGARLRDQRFERGVGGAVWFSAAMLRFNVAVARGIGSSTRAHVASTLVF